MKTKSIVGVLVLVVLGLLLSGTWIHRSPAAADPPPQGRGRYQLFVTPRGEPGCLLDTQTGKVWKNASGTWLATIDAP
jgi:hypothetical protein